MKDSRKDNQTKQELQYAKIQGAIWLSNLLAAGEVKLCERIFELFDYCTCELKKYLEPILKDVVKLLGHHKKLTRDYTSIQDLLKNKAYIVGRRIEELLFEYPEFENNFAMCMEKYLRRFIKAQKLIIPEDFGKAKETFSSLFGFDEKTIKIIDYMFLKNTYLQVRGTFEDILSLDKFISRDALAIALGMSKADIKSRLAELEDLGIISTAINGLNFSSNDIYRVWDVAEGKDPEELFCSPLKGETLPLSDFSVEQNQVNYVMDLIKSNKDEGVHILLYGPPGTGKTTFARSLALTLDVKAWVVVAEKEQNSGERRRMALTVCMNRAGSQKGSIVVVDEAENLLTDRHFLANQGKSIEKGWINEFLEKPGNPVIWIVNYPDMIDQTTIRRFSFAIHFPPLGLKERRRMWEAILKKHELDIPEEATILEKLVKKHKIPAAVIDRAVKQAMEIGGDANVIWENIGISVKSFELLQKGGDKPRLKGELSQGFTLEGVTAEFEARPFINKLKAIDGLRDKDGLHPGTGTMLFYGPPGTGKTALARYLADALGKDVIIKRASDIMNCFVGETEKNIAKAFSEAEAEDAVLVIDEADSFLYSRDMAVRSWETSFVNEFLTTLEECRCFMVATSNRRENMDPAAMRRFSFKIQFRYAGSRELVALYLALLAPLIGSEPDKVFLSNLSREKNIAPGDFHAVRCRNRIGLPKDASHYDLLRELIMERDLKLEKGITRIGF